MILWTHCWEIEGNLSWTICWKPASFSMGLFSRVSSCKAGRESLLSLSSYFNWLLLRYNLVKASSSEEIVNSFSLLPRRFSSLRAFIGQFICTSSSWLPLILRILKFCRLENPSCLKSTIPGMWLSCKSSMSRLGKKLRGLNCSGFEEVGERAWPWGGYARVVRKFLARIRTLMLFKEEAKVLKLLMSASLLELKFRKLRLGRLTKFSILNTRLF
mmetsp:Transcript_40135/g.61303  ORF Transcript_40135/g.61303 Transcript_40135/m.61303 type:complete len:215 (-) Transcript_40135:30-674(-)